jgi:branched-chain amino acid transport system permease protein
MSSAAGKEAELRSVPLLSEGSGYLLLVAGLILLPWFIPNYQRVFAAEIMVWGLFALSFAIVYGVGGMLSFAQAVFFGMGCWGFNFATYYLELNTWGAIVAAIAAAMLFALPTGFIATRALQHHFLIVTVIISVLVHTVLASGHYRWIAGTYVTRAMTFVPEVPIGFTSLSFKSELVSYYFTFFFVTVAVGLAWLIVNSPFGRALRAVRDNETRSALIGLNVNRLRFLMFVVATGFAGLAGALYALVARYTDLEFFHWTYSGKAVVLAVVGGVHSLVGPFFGTAFYMIASEHLSRYFEQFVIVFGIILLIVIRYAPEGLWGLIVRHALRRARR